MRITCVRDDGGRAAAGFMPADGVDDCVTRAIAIATERPYAEVHAELGRIAGDRRAPDRGLDHEVSDRYMQSLGWVGIANQIGDGHGGMWHATMRDLPAGRYVLIWRDRSGDGHFQAYVTNGKRGELRDVTTRTQLEDWVRHPMSGWWTPNPQRPSRRCPPPPPRRRRRR